MTATMINTRTTTSTAVGGLRICYVTLYIDVSASMRVHMKTIETAVRRTLQELADANDSAEDTAYLVKLVTFNDEVHVLNDVYLDPNEVLDLMPEDTFTARSTTNLTAMLQAIDADFSGSAKDLHTGDPYPFNLIITDWDGNEDTAAQAAAQQRLHNNDRFNKQAANLCIYCGSGGSKEDAAAIVGAENLIGLSPSLMNYLEPIIAKGTVVLSQTHMNDETGSVDQMTHIIDDVAEGASGSDALRAELDALFQ